MAKELVFEKTGPNDLGGENLGFRIKNGLLRLGLLGECTFHELAPYCRCCDENVDPRTGVMHTKPVGDR
jgi:hypothetical protein